MDANGVLELIKGVQQVGLVGVLVGIIVTGVTAKWVPGFAYREKKTERDEAVATLNKFVAIHESQTRAMEELSEKVDGHGQRIDRLCSSVDRLMERRGRA